MSNKLKRLGGWGARSMPEFVKIMTYNETHVLCLSLGYIRISYSSSCTRKHFDY